MSVRTSTPRSSFTGGSGPPPVSPVRRSRLQEKQELQELNDRLAACIECYHGLDGEKQALLQRLDESEEAASSECRITRSRYQGELDGSRQRLERTTTERARLEVELGRVSEEHRQLQQRNAKTESKLKSALAQLRDLEKSLNSKNAELATVLSEKRNLEKDVSELRVQLAEAKSVANNVKTQLDDEMLQRCDLTNRVQTLKEELDFQNSFHEQKITEIKRYYDSRHETIDSRCQQEYENKISEVLQELRNDQWEQIKQFKGDLNRNFEAKLESAQQTAEMHSKGARAANEELVALKTRTDTLTSQLQQCQKQNSTLQTKVQDIEMLLQRERAISRQKLEDKDREIAEIWKKLQDQLNEHGELLDVKLGLDMEISTYKKMLEEEEKRFNLTPTPPSHRGGHTSSRGKRRKMADASSARNNYETREHMHSTGKIILEEIDNEGRFIKLKNISNKDQPLNGWIIKREFDDLPTITYKFPASFTLKAGQVVTIWADNDDSKLSRELVWKYQKSWGIADDVRVALLDVNGKEVASRTIVKIPGRKSGEEDNEDVREHRSWPESRPMRRDRLRRN
uniref:lamin-B3-like isoform X2 n=1 Tax=Pristiophorus japonicus TaxID=55135 RepID=UPI00398EC6F0